MIRAVVCVALLALTQAWSTERITQRSGSYGTHSAHTMPTMTHGISGHITTNVLGARTGLDAETVGLRHPTYPYGQVDGRGLLLGRTGISSIGAGYGTLTQRGGGAHLSAASVVPARSISTSSFTSPVQTSSSSFQTSGSFGGSTFGAGSTGLGASVIPARSINVAPAVSTSSFKSQSTGLSGSFGASSGLNLGGSGAFQTRQVAVQPAVSTIAVQPAVSTIAVQPAVSTGLVSSGLSTGVSTGSAGFTQNVVSPPQVINEPAEVVHEKPTIIQGTVQNLPAENNVQETNMRTEENRQVNRNREINTYTVQRNRVNKVIQNVQRQTHHKHLNTNINTNIKRVHNPHVERELVTHVKNQVQPVELIYNKITNTESVQEETRPTQSESERTVQHPTVTLPLQSQVVADEQETLPGQRAQPVTLPVRQVASVNQGASQTTSFGARQVQTVQPSVSTVQTVQTVQPSVSTVSVVQPATSSLGFTGTTGLTSGSGSFQSGSSFQQGGSSFQQGGSSVVLPSTSSSSFEQTTVQTSVPAVSTVTTGLSGAGLSTGSGFSTGLSGAGASGFSTGLSGVGSTGVTTGDFARQSSSFQTQSQSSGAGSLGHRSGFGGVVPLGSNMPVVPVKKGY